MAVREALALCPELVLVCGEDLAEYRRVGVQWCAMYTGVQCILACFKMTMGSPNIMTFWHKMLHDIAG